MVWSQHEGESSGVCCLNLSLKAASDQHLEIQEKFFFFPQHPWVNSWEARPLAGRCLISFFSPLTYSTASSPSASLFLFFTLSLKTFSETPVVTEMRLPLCRPLFHYLSVLPLLAEEATGCRSTHTSWRDVAVCTVIHTISIHMPCAAESRPIVMQQWEWRLQPGWKVLTDRFHCFLVSESVDCFSDHKEKFIHKTNLCSVNCMCTCCCISDHWHRCTHRVHPGRSRPTPQPGPSRSGGLRCRPGGVGRRPVDGLQLGLRHQPGQGPGATHLHGSCRLGWRSFHVSRLGTRLTC